jgi:hypothetical protein
MAKSLVVSVILLSFTSLTSDILTCPQRLLSDSLPDRAGFDEEAEAVVRFGQNGGQRVHLRAQALHRLRVTRCTQLI